MLGIVYVILQTGEYICSLQFLSELLKCFLVRFYVSSRPGVENFTEVMLRQCNKYLMFFAYSNTDVQYFWCYIFKILTDDIVTIYLYYTCAQHITLK